MQMVEPAKTFEELVTRFNQDTDGSFKKHVYDMFVFGCKERERLRLKDKRLRQKKRDAIAPELRRKPGRPRKPLPDHCNLCCTVEKNKVIPLYREVGKYYAGNDIYIPCPSCNADLL